MGDKIELPGGEWAELRDPYTVTERERRPLKRAFLALSQAGSTNEAPGEVAVNTPVPPQLGGGASASLADLDAKMTAMEDFEAQAAAFFVTSWSFPTAPSADALLDLPAAAYAAIDEAVSDRLGVLFPQLAKAKAQAEGEPDPTTP
jgi:hypothetical protein